MNTNCEQVLNYCSSGSRGKDTIRTMTLKAISSVVENLHSVYFFITNFCNFDDKTLQNSTAIAPRPI
jgi:hypothetical protein